MDEQNEVTFHGSHTVVRLEGPITRERLVARSASVYADPRYREPHILWDLRQGTLALTREDLYAIKFHVQESRRGRGRGRVALVVSDDVAYGFSRMFEAIAGDADFEVSVFRDRDEAERWVASGTRTVPAD